MAADLQVLVRRYVTPERRYLKLGGGLLRMQSPERDRFVRDLRDDAGLLAAYLDRYLRRPDLGYDQAVVMGALRFIDLNLGGGRADRFREPGGLWEQWLREAPHMNGDSDPTPSLLSLIRRLCAFVDECAAAP